MYMDLMETIVTFQEEIHIIYVDVAILGDSYCSDKAQRYLEKYFDIKRHI